MAVATATATILFTSVASMREHQRHRAILWPVVAALAPGIIVGSLLGPQIVGGMSTAVLSAFYGVFVAAAATNTLLDRKPKPTRELPGKGGLFAVGGGIGLVSSMVGAGGAFLSVPFMTACNIGIRNCVATSAALGLPIAVAGTIGFVVAGLGQPGLPPHTIGYVYVPALLAIVAASVISAPIGARAAHRWPVQQAQAGIRAPAVRCSPPTCCGRPGVEPRAVTASDRAVGRRAGARMRPSRILSAQQVLLHLAHRVARQVGDEVHALGHLEVRDLALQRRDQRRSPSASWPGRATTTATTASPKSASGRPITADSTTPGSASIRSSISLG